MHPKLAAVYMTALAEQLGKDRGFFPVTDGTLPQLEAAAGCTVERIAAMLLDHGEFIDSSLHENEIEEHMALIVLNIVLLHPIETVPVKTLLQFRQKHAVELASFQEYLHKFAENLRDRQFESPAALQHHMDVEYKEKLRPQMDALQG